MAISNGTRQRFRRFQAPSPPEGEGPEFEVAGERLVTDEDGKRTPFVEQFRCLPALPGGVLTDLLIAGEQPLGIILERGVGLVRASLVPEDESRWDELIYSKETIVAAEVIAEVAEWLVEEFTGAPFVQPSDSAPGP